MTKKQVVINYVLLIEARIFCKSKNEHDFLKNNSATKMQYRTVSEYLEIGSLVKWLIDGVIFLFMFKSKEST